MSKEKILAYLQKNSWDLRKQMPSLIDAKFEENPSRLVLVFDSDVPDKLKNFTKHVDFEIEIISEKLKTDNKIAGENPNISAWKNRYKNVNLADPIFDDVKESVNPNSKNAQNTGAYEAWKKRHSGVKVR